MFSIHPIHLLIFAITTGQGNTWFKDYTEIIVITTSVPVWSAVSSKL